MVVLAVRYNQIVAADKARNKDILYGGGFVRTRT
jgi:hypothetical protein